MILIRADANEHIGIGHLMRCISIANAFAAAGEETKFVTADHNGDMLLEAHGFHSICLESKWVAVEGEITRLKIIVEQYKPKLLLIDSYYVTESYMTALKEVTKTAYIDDLNVYRYDIDCLINYNIYADTFDYTQYIDKGTKTLLGPKYVPLRSEFQNLQRHIINKEISNVFVSAGGSDPEHITEKMIKEVCPQWSNVRFHFVIGALNPRIATIKKYENSNIVLHINESHIAKIMRECDVAISAAGTTLYELCACGIPTIMYVLADNQIAAAKRFAEKGIMLSAGDCRGNTAFCANVELLLRNMSQVKRGYLSNRMSTLVDGKGADRIVEALLGMVL